MTNMYIMPKWQREAVAIIRNNGFISLKQVEFLQNEDEVFSSGKYTQKESILRAFCRNAGLVQVGKYLFNAYEAEEYGKKLEISEWREPSTAVEEALSFILQIAKHVKDKQDFNQPLNGFIGNPTMEGRKDPNKVHEELVPLKVKPFVAYDDGYHDESDE